LLASNGFGGGFGSEPSFSRSDAATRGVTRRTPTLLARGSARLPSLAFFARVAVSPGRFAPGRGGVDTLLMGLRAVLCAAGLVALLLCRGAGRVSSEEDGSGVVIVPKSFVYNDLGFRHE